MARSAREALVLRLYVLGVIQLALLAVAVFGVGDLIRHAWYENDWKAEHEHDRLWHAEHEKQGEAARERPAEGGAPDEGRPPDGRHHHGPPLIAPLLTLFVSGFVIVGVGALYTERWIVRPMLLAERQLLANVSHELRTPLARLRVALDIAAEAESGSERASAAEMAVDLAEVERLLDDILTATRLDIQRGRADAEVFPLRLETISPNVLAERAAERFGVHHPTRPLELETAREPPQVRADPVLFRRVLDNLLENAHKYTPNATRPVRLRTTANSGSVAFEIADEGIGIAPEDLPRVFTPFFRADRSRTRGTGGVGLGLTLVKRIVDAHGGSIALDSTPNAGTMVRITLPAVSEAVT